MGGGKQSQVSIRLPFILVILLLSVFVVSSSINDSNFGVSTDKPTYAVGERVLISVSPSDATYLIRIHGPLADYDLDSLEFIPSTVGTYNIFATLSKDNFTSNSSISFEVVSKASSEATPTSLTPQDFSSDVERKIKRARVREVVKNAENDFDVDVESNDNTVAVKFKGMKDSSDFKDFEKKIIHGQKVQINNVDVELTTDAVYVDVSNITSAEVTLTKLNPVNTILYCADDVFTGDCLSGWTATSIPFVDNGATITFTVSHFTTYAGGWVNQSVSVSASTNYTGLEYNYTMNISNNMTLLRNYWTLKNPTIAPSSRSEHMMAYDSDNKVMVLFGGSVGLSDTWVYNLSNETQGSWRNMAPSTSPTGRSAGAMAYDSDNKVMVLFGGYISSSATNETWIYNYTSNNWTNMTPPSSPSARYFTAMAYDSDNKVMVMYGGWSGSSNLADIWMYNLSNNAWTNITNSSMPVGRSGHAIVYDSNNKLIVMYGGDNGANTAETWIYNLSNRTWTQKANAPSARKEHAMAYDSDNKLAVAFGGNTYPTDTLLFNISNGTTGSWTSTTPSPSPTSRKRFAMAYDSYNKNVVLFGGSTGSNNAETWTYKYGYSQAGTYTQNLALNQSVSWDRIYFNGVYGSELTPDSSTVLLMHFNNDSSYGENDTWVYDFSGQGNNGTMLGGALWNSSGKLGSGAFQFDGVDDYINMTNGTRLSNFTQITLSAWVYIKSEGAVNQIISKVGPGGSDTPGYQLRLDSGFCSFIIGSIVTTDTVNTGSALPTNQWVYIVGTYNGTSMNLYVDGVLNNSKTTAIVLGVPTNPVLIGRRNDGYYFNGSIDEIAIFNRSLSAGEVYEIYRTTNLSSLQGYNTNVKYQAANSNDNITYSEFTGPDGTANSYYTYSGQALNLSASQYLKYKFYLSTDNISVTPVVSNITIKYDYFKTSYDNTSGFTANTQLMIWDDSETSNIYTNQTIRFYANYTNFTSGVSINDSIANCTFYENSAGSWSSPVNMTYNLTSGLYEYAVNTSYAGLKSVNITCDGSFAGYDVLSAVDTFLMNGFNLCTIDGGNLIITNNTNCTSQTLTVYGLNITNGGRLVLDNVTLVVKGKTIVNGTFEMHNSHNTIVQNDNLTILAGATYILDNSTLKMNVSYDGQLGITVSGTMIIANASNITNGDNASAGYFFMVQSGANFSMADSYLNGAGYGVIGGTYSTNGLWLNNNNSIIQNATITTVNRTGLILYTSARNTTVTNSRLMGNGGYGVILSTAHYNTFTSNNISSISNFGVIVASSNYNTFTNNLITTNSSSSSIFANYLSVSSYNNFTGNNIHSLYTSGCAAGGNYLTSSLNNNFISNNISSISCTGNSLVSSSNNNTFFNNIITTNSGYTTIAANSLTSSNYNNFTSNTMDFPSATAANNYANQLSSSSNNIFTLNNISITVGRANYMSLSNNNTFTSNRISSNSQYANYVANSANYNIFTSNIISSNTNIGNFVYLSASYNNFTSNNISSNSGTGNQIQDGANYNVFTSNTISSNTSYGNYIFNNAAYNTFTSNNISSVSGEGNYLNGADYNNFTSNNITSSTGYANHIQSADYNTFRYNNMESGSNHANYFFTASGSSGHNDFFYNNISTNGGNVRANELAVLETYDNFVGNRIINPAGSANRVAFASNSNNFTNNTIISNGTANTFSGSWNNIFTGNNITATGTGYAIYLEPNSPYVSNSNTFIGNIISANSSMGIYLKSVNYTNFTSNTIISNTSRAVQVNSSNYTYFINCNITSGDTTDIGMALGSFDNYLIDSTFNKTKLNVTNGSVYVQWYLSAYVGNVSGPLENATVAAFLSNGSTTFTILTDSLGMIPTQIITEYYRNASGDYSFATPVAVNTSKAYYTTISTPISVTGPLSINTTLYLDTSLSIYDGADLGTYSNNVTFYASYKGNNNSAEITPDANTVLLMHFNNDSAYGENSTKVYDFSGNGNNGTVTGNARWNSSGKFDGAYQFDGADNEALTIPNSSILEPQNITISLWAKLESYPSNPGNVYIILAKGQGSGDGPYQSYSFIYFNSTKNYAFSLALSGGGAQTTIYSNMSYNLTNNTGYHHLVGTYNGSLMSFYIDGVLQGTNNSGNPIEYATDLSDRKLRIGGWDFSSFDYTFNGSIDEVAIWNRSLSATEIQAIYDQTKGGGYVDINTLTGVTQNCSLIENSTGSWSSPELMNYNSTLGIYTLTKLLDGPTTYNITCNASAYGYTTLISSDTVAGSLKICDEGDLLTTCNVTSAKALTTNYTIYANNLNIKSSGALNGTTNSITLNLTGNLTIFSGGKIETLTSSGGQTAGNISIIANVVNVSGNVSSQAYCLTNNCNSGGTMAAGKINIRSNQFESNGAVESTGYCSSMNCNNDNSYGGQSIIAGGDIFINSTYSTINGRIKSHSYCSGSTCNYANYDWSILRSGNILITTQQLDLNGNLTSNPYCSGGNCNGRDGKIYGGNITVNSNNFNQNGNLESGAYCAGSSCNVYASAGGQIYAGNVYIKSNSSMNSGKINANAYSEDNAFTRQGGIINITINNTFSAQNLNMNSSGGSAYGNIIINTPLFNASGKFSTYNISIDNTGSLTIPDGAYISTTALSSYISITTTGNITIATGGKIETTAGANQTAGNITITANVVDVSGNLSSKAYCLTNYCNQNQSMNSGAVTIIAQSLFVSNILESTAYCSGDKCNYGNGGSGIINSNGITIRSNYTRVDGNINNQAYCIGWQCNTRNLGGAVLRSYGVNITSNYIDIFGNISAAAMCNGSSCMLSGSTGHYLYAGEINLLSNNTNLSGGLYSNVYCTGSTCLDGNAASVYAKNVNINSTNLQILPGAIINTTAGGSSTYISLAGNINITTNSTQFSPNIFLDATSQKTNGTIVLNLPNFANTSKSIYDNGAVINPTPWLLPNSLNCSLPYGDIVYAVKCNLNGTYNLNNPIITNGAQVYVIGATRINALNLIINNSGAIYGQNNLTINATDLNLTNSGKLYFNLNNSYVLNLNLTGNMLIDTTSLISSTVGTSQTGANITITTPGNINVSGNITAAGNSGTSTAGKSSSVFINANNLDIYGSISLASGYTAEQSKGGYGGDLKINVSTLNLYNNGQIILDGGYATSSSGASNNYFGGNGGGLNITSINTSLYGTIRSNGGRANPAIWDSYGGLGGWITITSNLSIINGSITSQGGNATFFDSVSRQRIYGGNASNITLTANTLILYPNALIIASGGSSTGFVNPASPSSSGNGGRITLIVSQLNSTSALFNATYGYNPSGYNGQNGVINISHSSCLLGNATFNPTPILPVIAPGVDTDSDGFEDSCDNCRDIPNTFYFTQDDTFEILLGGVADGIGDACDAHVEATIIDTQNDTIIDVDVPHTVTYSLWNDVVGALKQALKGFFSIFTGTDTVTCNGTTNCTATFNTTTTGIKSLDVNVTNVTLSFWNYSADSSLVALYHFDNNSAYSENDTLVYDFSGKGNNGTVTGGAVFNATGKINGSYTYDGVNDYINLSNNIIYINSSKPFSVTAWVKLDDFIANQYPVIVALRTDTNYQWRLALSNQADYIGIIFGSADTWARLRTNTPSASLTGTWKHVVVTYDGVSASSSSSFHVYLDGVSQSLFAANAFAQNTQTNTIGFNSVSQYWKGAIDEVAIFNKTLTASEVYNMYIYNNSFTYSNVTTTMNLTVRNITLSQSLSGLHLVTRAYTNSVIGVSGTASYENGSRVADNSMNAYHDNTLLAYSSTQTDNTTNTATPTVTGGFNVLGSSFTGTKVIGTGNSASVRLLSSPLWTAQPSWNAPDVGDRPRHAFADLDGDGDQDLLIGEYLGPSYAYNNTGNSSSPNWTAQPSWNAPDIGDRASTAFADLDGDGDQDLLIGSDLGVSYGYNNTGNASSPIWTAQSSWNTPDPGYSWVAPAFADLDGDGDQDLLIGDGSSGISYGYNNTGNASSPIWTAQASWNAPDMGTRATPAFADLDDDGDQDLLIGTFSGFIQGFKNTGNASSPIWTAQSSWDIADIGSTASPAFADLDGDGDQDLLIGEVNGPSYGYKNNEGYDSSGNYTSFLDAGSAEMYSWNNFSWTGTYPSGTNISFKVKTSSSNSSVPSFSSGTCNATNQVDNGTIVLDSSCANMTHRYLWYQATLVANSGLNSTPSLDSINVSYSYAITNSTDQYAFNVTVNNTLGPHNIKVNLTDAYGIYGELTQTYYTWAPALASIFVNYNQTYDTVGRVNITGYYFRTDFNETTVDNTSTFNKGTLSNVTVASEGVKLKGYTETSGIVGSYYLDQNQITQKDVSGLSNTATVNGARYVSTGKVKGAYVFNGSNNISIAESSSLKPATEVTVSAWININSTLTDYVGIVSTSDASGDKGYAIYYDADTDYINFLLYEGASMKTASSTTPLSPDQWYHVVGRFNGSEVSIYVDTVKQSTTDTASSITYNAGSKTLIGSYGLFATGFKGMIDEVKIFNRSLSQSEINQLYNDTIRSANGTITKTLTSDNTTTWKTISWSAVNATGEIDANTWSTGLVALYHFNNQSAYGENSTKIYDFSGGGNNGTVNGSAVWNSTGGRFNGAYTFDGVNDYINMDSTLDGLDQLSVSAWVKTKKTGGQVIISKYQAIPADFELGISVDNKLIFRIDSATTGYYTVDTSNITLDQWYHIVGVYSGGLRGNITLYVNGVYVNYTTLPADRGSSRNDPLNIGRRAYPGAETYFNGSIDEVAIWNRSLNASEIAQLYGAGEVKFRTKTSNDSITWSSWTNYSTNYQNTSINTVARYLMYEALITTNDGSSTPIIYNVSVDKTSQKVAGAQAITLVNQNNNSLTKTLSCTSVNGECEKEFTFKSNTFPTDLPGGNYTIILAAQNDSAYYENATYNITGRYFEEDSANPSYHASYPASNEFVSGVVRNVEKSFQINVTIINTNRATMRNINLNWYDHSPSDKFNITHIVRLTNNCQGNTLAPSQQCSERYNITLQPILTQDMVDYSTTALARVNTTWTDNDGLGNAVVKTVVFTLEENLVLDLSQYNKTHSANFSRPQEVTIRATNNGNANLKPVKITCTEQTLPCSWITYSHVGGAGTWIPVTSSLDELTKGGTYFDLKLTVTVPNYTASTRTSLINFTGTSLDSGVNITKQFNLTIVLNPNFTLSMNTTLVNTNLSYSPNITIQLNNTGNTPITNLNISVNGTLNASWFTFYLNSVQGTVFTQVNETTNNIVNIIINVNNYIEAFYQGFINFFTNQGVFQSINMSVNVTPKMDAPSELNYTATHASTVTGWFEINSTGNVRLDNLTISKSATPSSGFLDDMTFTSATNYAYVFEGDRKNISFTVDVPQYTTPEGLYQEEIRLTTNNLALETFYLNVEVSRDNSWSSPPPSQTQSVFQLNIGGEIMRFRVKNDGNELRTITVSTSGATNTDMRNNANMACSDAFTCLLNVTPGVEETFFIEKTDQGTAGIYIIDATLADADGNPLSIARQFNFSIENSPPRINTQSVIWNGYSGFVEQNKEANITADIRDDEAGGVNWTSIIFNFTLPNGTIYSYDYTYLTNVSDGLKYPDQDKKVPQMIFNNTGINGTYTFTAYAKDIAGNANSKSLNFEVYGDSLINFTATGQNITGISKYAGKTVSIANTLTRLNKTTSYNISLSGVFYNCPSCSVVSTNVSMLNSTDSFSLNITIPQDTSPRTIQFQPNLTWTTPGGQLRTQTFQNITLQVQPYHLTNMTFTNKSINHNTSSMYSIVVNAIGNEPVNFTIGLSNNITGIGIWLSQDGITNLKSPGQTLSFTNIASSQIIYVVYNSENGADPGITGRLFNYMITQAPGASDVNYSTTINVTTDSRWNISKRVINITTASAPPALSGEDATLYIYNFGNVPLNFKENMTIGYGNIYFDNSLQSKTFTVPKASNQTLKVTFDAPNGNQHYLGYILLNNTNQAGGVENITLDFYSKTLTFSEYSEYRQIPSQILAGDMLNFTVSLEYAGNYVLENTTYTIRIKNETCDPAFVNPTPINSYQIRITCKAPVPKTTSIQDATTYNITLEATYYSVFTSPATVKLPNTIYYKDITPPQSNNIVIPQIDIDDELIITANITDNTNIYSAWAVIYDYYGNLIFTNKTLTYQAATGLFNTSFTMPYPGYYNAYIFANDTDSNQNSSAAVQFLVTENKTFYGHTKNEIAQKSAKELSFIVSNALNTYAFQTSSYIFNQTILTNFYAIFFNLTDYEVNMTSVDLTRTPSDFLDLYTLNSADDCGSVSCIKGLALKTHNVTSNASVKIYYTFAELGGMQYKRVRFYMCQNFSYSGIKCDSSWSQIGTDDTVQYADGEYYIEENSTALSSGQNAFKIGFLPADTPEITLSSYALTSSIMNGTSTFTIDVRSSGTKDLDNVVVSCVSGTLCSLSFQKTNVGSLAQTVSESNSFNFTIPYQYPSGTYEGIVRYESNGATAETNVQITVIENITLQNDIPTTIETGTNVRGTLSNKYIENKGNKEVTLNFTSASLVFTPVTDYTLPINQKRYFNINYTSPSAISQQYYTYNTPYFNGSILMDVTHELSITGFSSVTDLKSGDNITIYYNATRNTGVEELQNVTSVKVYLDSKTCTVTSFNNSQASCTLPNSSVITPEIYVEVTSNYSVPSADYTTLTYADVFPPTLISYTRQDAYTGVKTIEFNLSDNNNIANATFTITSPSGNATTPDTITIVNNTVTITLNTTEIGDYIVNITPIDNYNNSLPQSVYYETYSPVNLSGQVDRNSVGVQTNLTFYRPSTTDAIHEIITDAEGDYNVSDFHNRSYDLNIIAENFEMNVEDITLSDTYDILDMKLIDFSLDNIQITNPEGSAYKLIGYAGTAKFTGSSGNITLCFDPAIKTGLNQYDVHMLRCSSFDFASMSCTGTWEDLAITQRDTSLNSKWCFSSDATGFSSYVLSEFQTVNVNPGNLAQVGGPGGGGGGMGGWKEGINSSEFNSTISALKEALAAIDKIGVDISEINKELYPGEVIRGIIKVANDENMSLNISMFLSGTAADFITLDEKEITIASKDIKDLEYTISIPQNIRLGTYSGELLLTQPKFTKRVPITIKILELKEQQIGFEIKPETNIIAPGKTLNLIANVYNPTGTPLNITLTFEMINPDLDMAVMTINETVLVDNFLSYTAQFPLADNFKTGNYILRGKAGYDKSEKSFELKDFENVVVARPILYKRIGPLMIFEWLLALLVSAIIVVSYYGGQAYIESRKRYHMEVDIKELPRNPGPRTAFIGNLAETNMRLFYDLDKLTTHTIIAGSTGGGKSISAQVLAEEALLKGISVIVFDPTAQWTGFLRKLEDKRMLDLYSQFGMTKHESRAFNGNIHTIESPRQKIDLKKYMVPGEIHIFTINKLDPKDIDIFVTNTVRDVFKANLEETQQLNCLFIYDEVHRLLTKFGGSGEGFIQIERACREFRKWGIGVMLVSQVLSDFVGQIKANINTEIQVRTKDEGDLERLRTKYGEEMLRAVVKANIGTGMLGNAAYNKGRPFFVTFRPIMHSVKRLTDDELSKYAKYNAIIDDYYYQVEQLEKLGVDVFDTKLEINLALKKLKAGGFGMVAIYLDGIKPKLEHTWKKIGKTPQKMEVEIIAEDELDAEHQKAKAERDAYLKNKKIEGDKKIKELAAQKTASTPQPSATSNIEEAETPHVKVQVHEAPKVEAKKTLPHQPVKKEAVVEPPKKKVTVKAEQAQQTLHPHVKAEHVDAPKPKQASPVQKVVEEKKQAAPQPQASLGIEAAIESLESKCQVIKDSMEPLRKQGINTRLEETQLKAILADINVLKTTHSENDLEKIKAKLVKLIKELQGMHQ